MKRVTIEGKCYVTYRKVIDMPDDEADEFMAECDENMDTAYCQIDVEDILDIDCVDDGEVSCSDA